MGVEHTALHILDLGWLYVSKYAFPTSWFPVIKHNASGRKKTNRLWITVHILNIELTYLDSVPAWRNSISNAIQTSSGKS